MEPSKHDWKLYREKVPGWQEHYMERLIEKIAFDDLNEFSEKLKENVKFLLERFD